MRCTSVPHDLVVKSCSTGHTDRQAHLRALALTSVYQGQGSHTPEMNSALSRAAAKRVLYAWEHAWIQPAPTSPACASCGLHSSAASFARPEAERGKAQQAEIAAKLEKIAPQQTKPPKRSPEQLAEAAQRAKEYSRRSMKALRQVQADQKLRLKLRCVPERVQLNLQAPGLPKASPVMRASLPNTAAS